MPQLTLNNISFAPDSNKLFEGLNLVLPKGRSIAISGGSGRGKTSLLRIIMGITTPTTGAVHLGDVNVTAASTKTRTEIRRRFFGSSPQTPHIIPSLTAGENVALALNLRDPRAKDKNRTISEALDRCRVLHLKDRYVDHLSGGEQRRIALARAIVGAPPIVCLDEPTEALDQALARQIIDTIFRTSRTNESSLVIATHDQNIIDRCDHHLDLTFNRLTR